MQKVPLKNALAQTKELLATLARDKAATLVAPDGQPAAYVIDPATFEALQRRLRILEGIARGEKAVREGRIHTHAQAKKKLARWFDH